MALAIPLTPPFTYTRARTRSVRSYPTAASSQPMLETLVAQGIAPKVDARPDAERIASWLEDAVRLGAVRIIN